MQVTQEDIGRKVVYEDGFGYNEEGVITSFNSSYVFVRYGSQYHSQATPYDKVSYL